MPQINLQIRITEDDINEMISRYHFNEDDFPEQFHKILFGSIFNIHALGAKEITLNVCNNTIFKCVS